VSPILTRTASESKQDMQSATSIPALLYRLKESPPTIPPAQFVGPSVPSVSIAATA